MLYIAFVCIFLSIFLFTYNKNHLSKKKKKLLIDSGFHNTLLISSHVMAILFLDISSI